MITIINFQESLSRLAVYNVTGLAENERKKRYYIFYKILSLLGKKKKKSVEYTTFFQFSNVYTNVCYFKKEHVMSPAKREEKRKYSIYFL